jgi:3-dehydroquinate synthase
MRVFRHRVRPEFRHEVIFTRGALGPENAALAKVFAREGGRAARVLAVVDRGVVRALRSGSGQARPGLVEELKKYFERHAERAELVAEPMVVPGGEAAKNDWRLVEKLWAAMERHGLSRQSYVLAVGGGAALDLAGFAAATAHRGVRLVRMPTTSLSQADGGVGVKNAVNFFSKKNWVGAFAVPAAVVNDFDFLRTQSAAAARGGVVEAFKVGLIRDGRLADLVERNAGRLSLGIRSGRTAFVYEKVIEESARLHLQHIATGGDPFEQGTGRPLDFGHWLAHKLEQMSGFRLPHGDAVAVGVAVDARYSAACGWLSERDARRVVQTLERLGCDTGDGRKNPLVRRLLRRRTKNGELEVLAGLEEFRQHLGGALTITLLRKWGKGEETSAVDKRLMREVVEKAINDK